MKKNVKITAILVMTITLTNIILPVVHATMEIASIQEDALNETTKKKQSNLVTDEIVQEEQNNLVTEETVQEEQNNATKDETIKTEQNTINTEETNETKLNNSSTEKIVVEEQLNVNNQEQNDNEYNIVLNSIINNGSYQILDKNGIWINESSVNAFLTFLNNHGIYTYTIDENGYLVCDDIMKNNPNLDYTDKSELDLEIKYILENDKKIFIAIDNKYLTQTEDEPQYSYLLQNEIIKVFKNQSGEKIVLLNSDYFNINTGFDLELSDKLIKQLSGNTFKATRSNTSKYGYMKQGTTVYAGPSSSDYATVGSVDENEMVYILGKSVGWYHIQYLVGSTGTQKSGFVPIDSVKNVVQPTPIHEEILTGGYRYANSQITVYSCDDLGIAVTLGTVFEGEGVTLIYDYGYSDAEKSYHISYIEFSTFSGTKRGYTYTSNLNTASFNTSVALVTSINPAYSGPASSYVKLGGVYSNEYVSILAKEGDWVFVEYNTASGRKRGFMNYNNLSNCNYPAGGYQDFADGASLLKATQEISVYGGPDSDYSSIGTIFNQEIVSGLATERGYTYIEYSTSSGAKRGYVNSSYLTTATAVEIPAIPTYQNFTKGTYGTSGLGEDLVYYKLGNGNNVLFMIFELHGWEDAWAMDGIELVNISSTLMSNLSTMDQSTFSDWSIYMVPYANPDGITDGYTNGGPGRCAVTSKVDMNRCWPANFVAITTSGRNYTGASPLQAQEALYLRNFLVSKESSSNLTVLLDVHGWYNETYGDADVATYFNQQFSNSHYTTFGSGYLTTWAKSRGYRTCLIELPQPASSQAVISNNYAGKLTNGLVNLITNIGGNTNIGGTDVNEYVKVTGASAVNVRQLPTTASAIITSLSENTVITRTKRSVTTANGLVWDQIVLNDGTIGYMATNYLTLVEEDTTYIPYTINDDIEAIKAYLKYNTIYYIDSVNNEYDNSLISALEEFQKENNLTNISGLITVETLQKMGFTVDINGQIVKNTFYQEYKNVAITYMYNSTYTFTNDSGNSVNIIFGNKKPELDTSYQNTRDTENSLYNSYSNEVKSQKLDKMKETEDKINDIIKDFGDTYYRAAKALQHYKDGTGLELNLGETNRIYSINDQKEERNYQIEKCMEAAERFISTNTIDNVKFYREYCYASNIGLGLGTTRLDWYAAANSFTAGVLGSACMEDGLYSMTLRFSFRDYYDWGDATFYFPPTTTIDEADLRDLHYAGRAKNFESIGCDYIVKVEWNAGTTISNATITEIS